jgi:hypothetical protein
MVMTQEKLIEFQQMLMDASYKQMELMIELLIHEMKLSAESIRLGKEGWEE